jgi:hypothetical protein
LGTGIDEHRPRWALIDIGYDAALITTGNA